MHLSSKLCLRRTMGSILPILFLQIIWHTLILVPSRINPALLPPPPPYSKEIARKSCWERISELVNGFEEPWRRLFNELEGNSLSRCQMHMSTLALGGRRRIIFLYGHYEIVTHGRQVEREL